MPSAARRIRHMGSTNYANAFIQVAEDCPVQTAEVPPTSDKAPTVAALQYEMLVGAPYRFTSDDVLFTVHAKRKGIPEGDLEAERTAFFAKDQACMRASPLGKRYGWGVHHDENSRVAIYPVGSERYQQLVQDASLKQLKAMRSKRA